MVLSESLIEIEGTIVFDIENVSKKHIAQSEWKKNSMVIFNDDICDYYAWFLNKKFNLKLNKPLRGAHLSFINDRYKDAANNILIPDSLWEQCKLRHDGKKIKVVLDISKYHSNSIHYYFIVPEEYRKELHDIRYELGLGKPYFGLHMSIGRVFEKDIEYSEYLNILDQKGFIELY